MKLFGWIRRGVREAIVGGVADAVNDLNGLFVVPLENGQGEPFLLEAREVLGLPAPEAPQRREHSAKRRTS